MIHFSIPKNELLELINKSFSDSIQLLDTVKKDYNRMTVYYNSTREESYVNFLQQIINFPDLLNTILLLCNQNAHFYYYNKLYTILSRYGYHIIQSANNDISTLITNITINPFVKQIVLENSYRIVEIDNNSAIKIKKNMNVYMIVNLSCNDDILFRIVLF
jgi:hypothetical protein